MNNVKIKLCGLSSEQDIYTANNLMPDYIGFVFYEKSRRSISPERAKYLKSLLKPGIKSVGVFVDESRDKIIELFSLGIIDAIQLHGHETREDIIYIKEKTKAEVIKAFNISSMEDIKAAENCPADYILFDSAQFGSGKTFDWTMLKEFSKPVFLAGGLTPDNVSEAIKETCCLGVDVSSGIETNGKKDPEKMMLFTYNARNN